MLRVLVILAVLVPLSASVDASGQSEAAHWRTIHNQGFEGATFPPSGGKWIVYDGSHTSTQGTWGKRAGGFNSANAASPRATSPYNYNTNTWMRYGPFSLAGAATNARMTFKYWMETEVGYDFFSWDYSCNGVGAWTGRTRSGIVGSSSAWVSANLSLQPCLGQTQVYVQFTFTSDQSVNYAGVFVDDVQIEKFS